VVAEGKTNTGRLKNQAEARRARLPIRPILALPFKNPSNPLILRWYARFRQIQRTWDVVFLAFLAFRSTAESVGIDLGVSRMDSKVQAGRLTVLDGGALVIGSSVASLHVLRVMRGGLSIAGWVMLGLTFTLLAVTASGPFIYIVRRFIRRPAGYPGVGDRLWALLGAPWALAAVVQAAPPGDGFNGLVFIVLVGGLAVASVIAVVEVWSMWVMVPPEQAEKVEAGPWTNRVGLALAIAWPIQCGLGLIVLG
jgi:hypothetical protein